MTLSRRDFLRHVNGTPDFCRDTRRLACFVAASAAAFQPFRVLEMDVVMKLVDQFLSTPSLPLPMPRPLPGCPAVPPLPPHDPATAQLRWDRSQRDRILDPDMLSLAQACAMTQLPEDEMLQLVQTGRAIALGESPGEYRLPFWQFFDPLWSCLPQIKTALGTDSASHLLSFLEESSDCMAGMMPRTAVERGHLSRVLAFAAWDYS
ncbi:hypothetical protein [Roseateles sp. L2-2]|uniref:hypothetical protein n=1 Tax=Roseateles sp. L2-2 TaxID=3422597 RepID=UPI003D3602F9